MSTRRLAALLPLAATLAFTACAGTRPVSLTVTDGSGSPIAGATISAVPVATSLVPLPLSSETLGEILAAKSQRLFAVTDERGRATLSIQDKPHALDVSLPALFESTYPGPWRFTLDPDAHRLEPPSDRPNPPGLALTLTKP